MQLDSQKHSIFKNYDHTASEMFSILDFQGNVLNREFANEFKEKDLLKYQKMYNTRQVDNSTFNKMIINY